MIAFGPFIGLSWRAHGRDRSGLDCWGLVRLFHRDVLGIELPAYNDAPLAGTQTCGALAMAEIDGGEWLALGEGEAEPGDVILLERSRRGAHVGIVSGPGAMLHIDDDHCGSRIIRFAEAPLWRHWRRSFWRHRARS